MRFTFISSDCGEERIKWRDEEIIDVIAKKF